MRAAGMPPGMYRLGSQKDGLWAVIEDGVAKLADHSAFAGSIATSDRLVQTMVQQAGLTPAQAVQMITENPARAIGRWIQIGSGIRANRRIS